MAVPCSVGDAYAPSHAQYAEGRIPAGHVTGEIQTLLPGDQAGRGVQDREKILPVEGDGAHDG